MYVPKKIGNEDPNLPYGVVIECGSSGSRLYIYVWPEHPGKENELLQIKQLLDKDSRPVVKKLEPGQFPVLTLSPSTDVLTGLGLSSMAKTPKNATEYLKSLLGKRFVFDTQSIIRLVFRFRCRNHSS